MKAVRLLLLLAMLLVLPWGSSSSAEAGCGGSSGCGMSHEKPQQAAATVAKPGQYTCPMHPDVISDEPGKCPKCGMALEKVPGQISDQQELTGDMAAQCQQVVDEFTALQDHFEVMMKLTDIGNLASEMVKHREMMVQFADDLSKHQEACRQMASVTEEKNSSGLGHSNHGH